MAKPFWNLAACFTHRVFGVISLLLLSFVCNTNCLTAVTMYSRDVHLRWECCVPSNISSLSQHVAQRWRCNSCPKLYITIHCKLYGEPCHNPEMWKRHIPT